MGDAPLGRIVAAWHVGESHTHESLPACIAPELCTVGHADAEKFICAGIEPVAAGDNNDVTVLSRDYTTRDLHAVRRVCDDGRQRDRERVRRQLLVARVGGYGLAGEAADHQGLYRFPLRGDSGRLVENP